jgi:hypothetical protein
MSCCGKFTDESGFLLYASEVGIEFKKNNPNITYNDYIKALQIKWKEELDQNSRNLYILRANGIE